MIILMIKLLLLMLPKTINAKKIKQSYSGKRKTHDQNTSNYRTRNQNYCNRVFRSEKHDYALFKESKSQF
ncbi:hypothetical protein [Spiroplasma poulsonii]|uniref:hypothetical protein n=1 Tax=Spiroplasma poulsonii TaxID=2138 RepID=UPI001F4CA9A9|nr:hypothetical protein [Spiroplasma poulsonii]UNF61403.1 hypothetical protein MNU24_05675 [Spiroplasma poulsonii]